MERNKIKPGFTLLDNSRARESSVSRRYLTGFTLIELMVVVAIIVLLVVFGLPAVRTMVNSFHAEGNTRAMINSAMAAARATAMKEQTAAGVRFQYAYNPRNGDEILDMPQYMIFIRHDFDSTGLAYGFRAVEGMEPVKLPESVGIMDLKVRMNSDERESLPEDAVDTHINTPAGLRNATTFSIIFSSSGKLIVHEVRVRNKDGETNNSSFDEIFNTQTNVENNNERGMFYQDDYATLLGLGQERSRSSFIIFDANILKKTAPDNRWNNYLKDLPVCHINPYTGAIINK